MHWHTIIHCNTLQRTATHFETLQLQHTASRCALSPEYVTGWRRSIGCLKLQVICRKRATNYGALLRKCPMKIRHPMTLHHPVRSLLPEQTHERLADKRLQQTVTHCDTLQRTATHCNALQCSATNRNTPQHTATHYDKPQHTTTHCNYTATRCNTLRCASAVCSRD